MDVSDFPLFDLVRYRFCTALIVPPIPPAANAGGLEHRPKNPVGQTEAFLDRGWKAGVTEAIELTNLLTVFLQSHDKPSDDVVYAAVSKDNALNNLAFAAAHSPTNCSSVTECWAGG